MTVDQAAALVVGAVAMGLVRFVPMILDWLAARMGVDVPPPPADPGEGVTG